MMARIASALAPSLAPAARRAGAAPVRPQLTSLVDMMTILLVFLLKSFSVEGELMTIADDLELPASSSRDRAQPEVSVEVTRNGLAVDGRPLLDLAMLAAIEGLTIPALGEELTRLAAASPARAGVAAGSADGPVRTVTIQCDRDHDFRVLKRVMATCSLAGYEDFSLLVLREEP